MSNIIKITLDKGMCAVIDAGDFELVSKYRWYARRSKNGTYYATASLYKNIHMHRLILGLSNPKLFTDHIDHNGLNNTRINLRIVTYSQNNCNTRSRKNSSSKFKGVYWNKEKLKWTSQIKKSGQKTTHIGHFNTEIEAAIAYNEEAIKAHGEFAFLNVINQDILLKNWENLLL